MRSQIAAVDARRGIGLGLVKKFLSRGNTVIATSREGSKATHLQQLRGEYPERLRITDLNIALPANAAAWAEGVKGSGVKGIDASDDRLGRGCPRGDMCGVGPTTTAAALTSPSSRSCSLSPTPPAAPARS